MNRERKEGRLKGERRRKELGDKGRRVFTKQSFSAFMNV